MNKPFKLRLLNGMNPPVPEATIIVERIVRDYRNKVFQLHLGQVLEVKHWDRKRKPQKPNAQPLSFKRKS